MCPARVFPVNVERKDPQSAWFVVVEYSVHLVYTLRLAVILGEQPEQENRIPLC